MSSSLLQQVAPVLTDTLAQALTPPPSSGADFWLPLSLTLPICTVASVFSGQTSPDPVLMHSSAFASKVFFLPESKTKYHVLGTWIQVALNNMF